MASTGITLVILDTWEAEIRILVQGQPRPKTLSQKYPAQKRAGGVVQGVDSLPSKCEALSSNPSTVPPSLPTKKSWLQLFRALKSGSI
jgi:hypothetical protein